MRRGKVNQMHMVKICEVSERASHASDYAAVQIQVGRQG
jgi:hypothetical protein